MKTLIGGGIAVFIGIIGLLIWWKAFFAILSGSVPIILFLGGCLAIYLGFDELKDSLKSDDESDDKEEDGQVDPDKKSEEPEKETKPVKKASPAGTGKEKPVKKAAGKEKKEPTAKDTVFGIISKSRKTVDTAELQEKTGFEGKKLNNILYKLKKEGKIKREGKGLYKKA